MDMNVSFHHPIASSAEAIWDMEEKMNTQRMCGANTNIWWTILI